MVGTSLSLLDVDQPAGSLVVLAGGFFEDLVILFDVVQALADLDQPDAFEAGDAGAVNAGRAALAVVALAVPAAEGEGDLFLRLGEEGFEVLPQDRGVVVFEEEVFSQISSSKELMKERPLFHFASPAGWCNDPNGFSQFGDKIHLFYQYHPYSIQWGPMHWGHVLSDDMLSWKLEPLALAPDSLCDEKGCFSGTALEDNNKHILAYTGVSNNGNQDVQNQCIAVGDGLSYKKISSQAILTAADIPFEYNLEHFRDPKIWKKDGLFYMLCVIKQKNDRGAMILFNSDDAIKWTYKGILDSSKDGLSNMWECPDYFQLDGKDLLIFSPQEVKENDQLGFHNGNNSVYVSGKLDYQKCTFSRELRPENSYTAALIDYGIDFYAPETTKLKDGRTIMIAWMQAWESYITPKDYLWSGMMTLPRELSFKNKRLYQLPVKELEKWKQEKKSSKIQAAGKVKLLSQVQRHFEIDFKIPEGDSVKLFLGDDKENIILEINGKESYISFDRSNSAVPGSINFRKAKLRTDTNDLIIKVICDTCSIEVFINEGIMAFTNAFFFNNTLSDLLIENKGCKDISYDLWMLSKNKESLNE